MQSETTSMKVKSYFANSVELAIQEARRDLGGDAVLITTRRADRESRHLGAYEVVFGITVAPTETDSSSEAHGLTREVAALRDQLDNIRRMLQGTGPGANHGQPEVEELYQELLSAGFDAITARSIADDASAAWLGMSLAQRSAALLQGIALERLRERLDHAPELRRDTQESKRAMVFVGPPGAGKTTTLVKFAIRECLGRRLSMRIVSVDPYRVAAHEKLRAYARIMGVGFTAASSIREFIEALDEFRAKDILLIDTPGFCNSDLESLHETAGVVSQLIAREVHLVLPASMNREDLMRSVTQYAPFQADHLLFTKLDETTSRGAAICTALEAEKPLSFFTTGQSIPEDIQPARPEVLMDGLFRERSLAASPAA